MSLSASGYVVAAGGLGIWISSLGTGWLVGKYFLNREPLVIAISALISAVAIFAIFHARTPLIASLLLFIGEIFPDVDLRHRLYPADEAPAGKI